MSADAVLTDGRLVHASQAEHSDVFWAIEDVEPTLRWYREWLPSAPPDINAFYLTAEVPAGDPLPSEIHGRKMCGLVWCCTGPKEQASTPASPRCPPRSPRCTCTRSTGRFTGSPPTRPPGDTATRSGRWSSPASTTTPRTPTRSRAGPRDYWAAVHPHTAGAAYINFMMDEGAERVAATYAGNFERPGKIKAKYDPDNSFHINQNIEPAG